MSYSTSYARSAQSVVGDDVDLILLTIEHADLATPIRVCNNTADVTSGGHTYVAAPFSVTLPDDRDGQAPRATLTFANAGRELMQWIEQAGGGVGATATFAQVRASDPDVIESQITVDLLSLSADPTTVTGTLGYDVLLDRPFCQLRYDPSTAPGIF